MGRLVRAKALHRAIVIIIVIALVLVIGIVLVIVMVIGIGKVIVIVVVIVIVIVIVLVMMMVMVKNNLQLTDVPLGVYCALSLLLLLATQLQRGRSRRWNAHGTTSRPSGARRSRNWKPSVKHLVRAYLPIERRSHQPLFVYSVKGEERDKCKPANKKWSEGN